MTRRAHTEAMWLRTGNVLLVGLSGGEAPGGLERGITQEAMDFVDGDKRTYIETYEMVMKILNPGGYILADNTLWDGHVIDPAYDRDHQTNIGNLVIAGQLVAGKI